MSSANKRVIRKVAAAAAMTATIVAGGAFGAAAGAERVESASVDTFAGNYVTVTDSNYDQVMAETKNKTLILVFSTAWCGACKELHPIIERMASQSGGKWQLGFIDAEKVSKARQYNIRAYPTEVAILGGREVGRKVYMDAESDLQQWINEMAAKAPGGGGSQPAPPPPPPRPTPTPPQPPKPTWPSWPLLAG